MRNRYVYMYRGCRQTWGPRGRDDTLCIEISRECHSVSATEQGSHENEAVFGTEELRRFPSAAGKLLHAEVRIDDTVVMIPSGRLGSNHSVAGIKDPAIVDWRFQRGEATESSMIT